MQLKQPRVLSFLTQSFLVKFSLTFKTRQYLITSINTQHVEHW